MVGRKRLKNAIVWAILCLILVSVGVAISHGQNEYYAGLGTNNFEVGMYYNETLQLSSPTTLLIAMVENTGNINLTLSINPSVSYMGEEGPVINPSFFNCTFYGCEYYTRREIAYPFFIQPATKVDIYANITLGKIGTYNIRFDWNVTNQIPYDYAGKSLSTPGGKATAQLICEYAPLPFNLFGFDPSFTYIAVAGAIMSIATVLSIKKWRGKPHATHKPKPQLPIQQAKLTPKIKSYPELVELPKPQTLIQKAGLAETQKANEQLLKCKSEETASKSESQVEERLSRAYQEYLGLAEALKSGEEGKKRGEKKRE